MGLDAATQLEHELQVLLGSEFAVAAAPLDHAYAASLTAEERQATMGVAAQRRVEFATGRACARRAMVALGVGAVPLPRLLDGRVGWPNGVRGSISHTDGMGAAVATLSAGVVGVGIDLEHNGSLEIEEEELVCTLSERAWIAQRPAAERGRWGMAVFCAKEAFYKCQYEITQGFLDFDDVEIALASDGLGFRVARVSGPFAGSLDLERVRGGLGYAVGHTLAVALMRR